MNNFKRQYFVGEWKSMDIPIAIRIPSFENSFWIYLSASIITVDEFREHSTETYN
jgi:hypothetical protein